MKLTIVLTVYNKKPFIRRVFDALLNQEGVKKGDYEVLVVNDGSTDGSTAIIDEYVQKDSRIRVLTQKNQGLSMARNNGAEAAQGEYIWFVDADDSISSTSVNLICGAIEKQPDIIPIYAQTDGVVGIRNQIPITSKSGIDIILSGRFQVCGPFYIMRKAFLDAHKLRFFPGIYHEDAEFTPRALYFANKVVIIPEVLYTVYRDPGSIIMVPKPERAYDYLTVAEHLQSFMQEHVDMSLQLKQAYHYIIAQVINNALSQMRQVDCSEHKRYNVYLYKHKDVLKSLKMSRGKYRIQYFVFSLFPKHYVGVYKMMKKFG